jgi:uncharacterized 2Fe-2S/4Fe-4S cluster protein (DUF4445 family)
MTQTTNNEEILKLDIQPVGLRTKISREETILEAAQEAGVGLVSLCGGEGWCYSCLIKIVRGDVSDLTGNELDFLSDEEISEGYRLACQAKPRSDLVINIPPDSLSTPQRLQVEGLELEVPLDPVVEFVDLVMDEPSLDDLRSDVQRVREALSAKGFDETRFDFPLLAKFSEILRENEWRVRAVIRDGEVITLLPEGSGLFGIAVDIGTTKVAVYLLSLESGEVIDKRGEMNPQIAYGEDVISRISYTNQNGDGRKILQDAVVETLNYTTEELCKHAGISTSQVVDAVVVGNTAIHHLFVGLPVRQLVYAPYVAAENHALDIRASSLGFNLACGAYVHLLPNIAGYVGADHSAVILATELWKTSKTVIAIDIGTNTEITLASGHRLLSCSCASGPAFEGAHIRNGMRAAPGAIERIQLSESGEANLYTIDDQPPVGICGSGILDAVAELKEIGAINEKGAFNPGKPKVRGEKHSQMEYVLVPKDEAGHGREITVTRGDINEIQLAKGAIRAGLEVLLDEARIEAQDVDEIIIAGAFGTYIDVENAVKIGMFPDVPLYKFSQVGNAAGLGARLALISREQRKQIQHVIGDVDYIELTTSSSFQDAFMSAMFIR